MNHIYKVIFNKNTGTYTAVSELAKTNSQSSTTVVETASLNRLSKVLATLMLASGLIVLANPAQAINGNAYPIASGGATVAHDCVYDLNSKAIVCGDNNTQATGDFSAAIGPSAKATSNSAIALGRRAEATAAYATAIGLDAKATGIEATAMGRNAQASGRATIAIGLDTAAPANYAIAIGKDAKIDKPAVEAVKATSAVIIGHGAKVVTSTTDPAETAKDTVTIGYQTESAGSSNITIGSKAKTTGKSQATAIGFEAIAEGYQSMAFGSGASVISTAGAAIAMGRGASATLAHAVALGSDANTAVAATKVNNAMVNGITYDGFAGTALTGGYQVSVGMAGKERQIKNVAPGEISATSTDAINGSQLYLTNHVLGNLADSIKEVFGGNAVLEVNGPDAGKITFTDIGGTNKNTIHQAILASREKVEAAPAGGGGGAGNPGVTVTEVVDGDGRSTFQVALDAATQAQLKKEESVSAGNANISVTPNGVNATGGTDYQVTLNNNLNLTPAGSVQIGATTINNNGVVIAGGPSMTAAGIDAGNKVISGVAPGVAPTDAVNLNQLNTAVGGLQNNINQLRADLGRVEKNADAGAASAGAMANLPRAYLPGKSLVGIATAGYRGQQGYAVGVSRVSDNGKWLFNSSVSANSQGKVMYGAGLGYQW